MLQSLRSLRLKVLCFLLLAYLGVHAQSVLTWEEFVEQTFISDEESEDENYVSDLYQELQEIHDHPFNINTITEEQLSMLPFLNDVQRKDIIKYVSENSPVRSLGELMLIYSLDQVTRLRLMLFCRADEIVENKTMKEESKKLLKYGKNELVVRTDIPFYTKAGYEDVSDSVLMKNPNKEYRGDRFYRSVRYSFSSMKHLDAGLQIEKDAGEKDFDYFSAYVFLKNIGKIKVLALGDYKVSFGQGLVVNTSMEFGKLMTLSSMGNMDRGISRHSSMSETGYMRGVATTLEIARKLNLSAFVSYRNVDGTELNDSSDIITSLNTSGLHRTQTESDRKGNTGNFTSGGNIRWETLGGKMRVGATAVYSHLSKPLEPKYNTPSTLYRYYNARGTDFGAFGVSYSYIDRKLAFSGETAMTDKGNVATINTLQFKPNEYNSLTLIQRSYSAKYATLYGKSFGENSIPQNESGLFVGWNTTMIRNVRIETFFDWFYFPYLKYQVSESSNGYEGLAQMTYTPSSSATISLRYKLESKQKDFKIDDKTATLAYYTNQNIRLQYSQNLSNSISLKSSASLVFNHKPSGNTNKGMMISEIMRWTGAQGTKLDIGAVYFNTDDYDSRVYGYESGLLYSFGMKSYYYHGMRATMSAIIPIAKGLSLRGKCGWTKYFDRDVIGTALEQISSSSKLDLQLQARWVF